MASVNFINLNSCVGYLLGMATSSYGCNSMKYHYFEVVNFQENIFSSVYAIVYLSLNVTRFGCFRKIL